MDKQQLAEKATETLRPFETRNLMDTIQNLTLHDIFTNPVILITILAILFFGIYKRSMPVILTLFALIAFIVVMRFLMPPPGEEMTMKSLFPFVGAGVTIGGIIIYFSMIRS